jgi:cyclophilin family peptidyl-prolyl cis-trans isomerase
LYQQAKTPYEKADCLAAAAEYGWQYLWIHDKGTRDPHPAVRSAAAAALLKIMHKPNFYAAFGEGAKEVRRNLYNYLREIGNSGDPGMIAEAIDGFRSPVLAYKGMRDSTRIDDLKNTLHNKLKLPQDYEAYEKLDSAIAFLEERPFSPKLRLNWNHPIDWQRLSNVSAKTEVTLQTSRGTIVMELYPEWAPNTVATFVSLCQTNFYNGKNFHRIVPNFVAQGGCPRGDGYGAQDFSLRSEIGLAWYEAEGYVGMASAGKDTEGTQFFITHSPTPHLSGRYTIFGKVKKGMDAVYKLQAGDVMEKMSVTF